ncbi:universal stress protein [Nocardia sp. NEAU-G5]|uniref:Universal stress protein n=1 Tax=Nocardia albiluteola TaxID=2842303 RepID=A0ABS6AWH2_9NOCA|nr:universal stress protein [Nocardia albiluteola]MBU3062405.1 universal stress protein [Nocardia albiluteola]
MTSQDHDKDPHHVASAAVVVGVDGSRGSDIALHWAADYAAHRGRELQIVHGMGLVGTSGVAGYAMTLEAIAEAARAEGREVVERAEEVARLAAPELRVSGKVGADNPANLLIDRSATAFAVVLGSTGSAGTLAHLGSTLLAVTAHAYGAVIVVPDEHAVADRTGGPVVVGIDGSPISEPAIAAAFAEAAERRTDLVAVHVCSDWDFGRFAGTSTLIPDADAEVAESAILAERLAGWQEKYPDVPVTRQTYLSAPAAKLQEYSKTAQLIVVGSHGRGGVRGLLLGSTSNYLVQHAYCPVMVVHQERK